MYHCGSAPALHHIGNGMFGALIVDPPGLPVVADEFVIVQSELALGAQDGLAKLGKLYRGEYDAIAFNGYAEQYVFAPLTATAGKRVRIWAVDAGPSAPSAFHVVGTVFDTVFADGAYLLRRNDPARGGGQALNLAPHRASSWNSPSPNRAGTRSSATASPTPPGAAPASSPSPQADLMP